MTDTVNEGGGASEESSLLSSLFQLLVNYSLPMFYLLFPAIVIPIVIVRLLYSLLAVIASGQGSGDDEGKKGRLGDPGSPTMEVEYWMHRCSICFEANQELCLNRCRDQFCRDCFNRYVKEVVNNSWGLNVTKIKCPVCQDPLPIAEWSKHVDSEIVALYNTYNQPYRSVTRCCGNCGEIVYSAKVELDLSDEEKFSYLDAIFSDCRFLLEESNTSLSATNHFLNNLEFDYRYFLSGRTSGGIEVYRRTINRLLKALSSSRSGKFPSVLRETLMELASNISSRLIAIELKPEIWKELQFEHIVRFPRVTCESCNSPSCLKCASPNHHSGLTCLDFMRKQLEAGIGPPEKLENIRWTLQNSKSCPHCQILINRDDGCNRVDCLYCGFRFCWICLNTWSEKCGFYQCQETPQLANGETAFDGGSPSDKPELGIPDVVSIEAKLGSVS